MLSMNHTRATMLAAVAVGLATAVTSAWPQTTYPAKPVRILVGFAPGGFTDIAARIVGQKFADSLSQSFVVENRPGANGGIAADLTSRAAPDGYTIFMSHAGTTINPHLHDKVPYHPLRDFTAISLVATTPNILVVHPTVPAKSVKELLALARTRPGSFTQATAGFGSPGHLSGELLQLMTQTKFVSVAYKGSGPALIDLLSGYVDLSFPTIAAVTPHLKTGRLRALGVTSAKRSSSLPDVPTIAEAGVPGFEVVGWYGLLGPAGMPKEIASRLANEVAQMMKAADVRERMISQGAEPVGNTPEEFTRYLAEEFEKWGKVVKATKIREKP
ncbi:MAG: LacI family transcriptional regulator [Betaproteobacteria bacterium RIFCSPLOWO2_12_FULL_62_13]|nr:MAG: LacI family transcriptional regulator [Betaproteobacteria bacterium RIFCSPLOWO2_12_FULL_62_13]